MPQNSAQNARKADCHARTQLGHRPAEQVGGPAGAVGVAQAVEAVAMHAFLRVPPGQGECPGDRGLRAVEGGVEAGHLRQIRGMFRHRLNCRQVVRLVRREDVNDEQDPMYEDAVRLVLQMGKASTSTLQRHLRLGYGRAARILDMMQRDGIIGPPDGSKPREVLKRPDWHREVENQFR